MDEREQAVEVIEALFPPETEIGQELLRQAKREVESWRHLPLSVLTRYAALCREKEQQQGRD